MATTVFAVFRHGALEGVSRSASEEEATSNVAYRKYHKNFSRLEVKRFRNEMKAYVLPDSSCPVCSGIGSVDDEDRESSSVCPLCHGLGSVRDADEALPSDGSAFFLFKC